MVEHIVYNLNYMLFGKKKVQKNKTPIHFKDVEKVKPYISNKLRFVDLESRVSFSDSREEAGLYPCVGRRRCISRMVLYAEGMM